MNSKLSEQVAQLEGLLNGAASTQSNHSDALNKLNLAQQELRDMLTMKSQELAHLSGATQTLRVEQKNLLRGTLGVVEGHFSLAGIAARLHEMRPGWRRSSRERPTMLKNFARFLVHSPNFSISFEYLPGCGWRPRRAFPTVGTACPTDAIASSHPRRRRRRGVHPSRLLARRSDRGRRPRGSGQEGGGAGGLLRHALDAVGEFADELRQLLARLLGFGRKSREVVDVP